MNGLRIVDDPLDGGQNRASEENSSPPADQPADGGVVKIRMKISVTGVTHGIRDLARGQIIEVPKEIAKAYCRNGYAQSDLSGPLGLPYKATD